MSPRHPGPGANGLDPGGLVRGHQAAPNHLSPASLNAGERLRQMTRDADINTEGASLSVPSPAPHCVSPGPPPEIHIHQVSGHQMDTGGYEGAMGPLHKRLRRELDWSS